jgi:hypothetical protein
LPGRLPGREDSAEQQEVNFYCVHALRATFLRVEATRNIWRRYAPGRSFF